MKAIILAVMTAFMLTFAGGPEENRTVRYSAPIVALNRNQSSNWAGYNQGFLEKGTQFSSISGDWQVPKATYHSQDVLPGDQFSATWIGIGGGCIDADCVLTDPTLIQAGTSQNVTASGQASYDAWWELIPLPSITTDLAVHPGNRMHVEIAEILPLIWEIKIQNLSTGGNFSITVPYPSTKFTAEWIEETPIVASTGGGVQVGPMPNLSGANFFSAKVNEQPAGLIDAEALELVDGSGTHIATPSAPSGGTAFSVCTYSSHCP